MLDRCTKRGTTCTLLSLNGGTSRLIREPHRAKRGAATIKRFSNGGTPLFRCCSPPGLWIQRRTYIIGRQTGRPTPKRPRVNTSGQRRGRQAGRPPPNDPGRNSPGRSHHHTGAPDRVHPVHAGTPSQTQQRAHVPENNGAPENRNPLPFAFELWKSKEASPSETQRKTFGRTRSSLKEKSETNTGE